MIIFTIIGLIVAIILAGLGFRVLYQEVLKGMFTKNNTRSGSPCRKHYFNLEPFDKCPDCGWWSPGVQKK